MYEIAFAAILLHTLLLLNYRVTFFGFSIYYCILVSYFTSFILSQKLILVIPCVCNTYFFRRCSCLPLKQRLQWTPDASLMPSGDTIFWILTIFVQQRAAQHYDYADVTCLIRFTHPCIHLGKPRDPGWGLAASRRCCRSNATGKQELSSYICTAGTQEMCNIF